MEPTQTIAAWLQDGSINLFGRPFAGKDTQARMLADSLNGAVIGGGDIFRGTTIPEEAVALMRAGHLMPSELFIELVLPKLADPLYEHRPLILSSMGRWHGEEEGVIGATAAAKHPLKAVIYLSLPEDAVRQRWQSTRHLNDRGDRHDDTEEVLEVRLEEYRQKTLPVIEYYRLKNMLIEIDATQTIEAVHRDILDKLALMAANATAN